MHAHVIIVTCLQILQLFLDHSQFDLQLYRKQLITDCLNKPDPHKPKLT